MDRNSATQRIAIWFRQWQRPLRNFLSRKGSVAASELDDVAQEVFLRLMRYERTELIENPQAYLFKMASNVAAEWALRDRQRRRRDAELASDLYVDEACGVAAVQLELQEEVERALLSLSASQRQVLSLQFYQGLSRADIAARLGISERSVKRTLVKCYQKLRLSIDLKVLRGIADGDE